MEAHQRPILALGIRLLAAGALATMLMLVKLAGQHGVSLPETIFWRQLMPTLLIGVWFLARGRVSQLKSPRFPSHVRRAAVGLVGMFLNLGVVLLLPLTESTVLGFTSPIFAVILAAVLLKERVGPVRWLAVALGLAGIAIIAGPGKDTMPLAGLAVGIGAAFAVALTSILIRDLARTEEPLVIVFWFSALSTPVLLVPALWWGAAHDAQTWAILIGVGVVGALGQILLTAALRFGSVSSVIVMDYSAFGWAMLWGWLVFDQLPPATTWLGAPVVIAAGLIIVWREHRLHIERQVAAVSE